MMQMVVVARVMMARDVVDNTMLSPSLHVSIARGMVMSEIVVRKILVNLMGFLILSLLMLHLLHCLAP